MKTHDYIHHYRGYWDEGGVCRIRIYEAENREPVAICSELPENTNTSITNMAEYIAAEVIEEYGLPTPLTWIEHYPIHERGIGEYALVEFSPWQLRETHLGDVARKKLGTPRWSHLSYRDVCKLVDITDASQASSSMVSKGN